MFKICNIILVNKPSYFTSTTPSSSDIILQPLIPLCLILC